MRLLIVFRIMKIQRLVSIISKSNVTNLIYYYRVSRVSLCIIGGCFLENAFKPYPVKRAKYDEFLIMPLDGRWDLIRRLKG